MTEDSDIEIRPYFEVEDFGEAFTPELQEQEAALRASGLGLNPPTFQDCPDIEIAGLNQSYTIESRDSQVDGHHLDQVGTRLRTKDRQRPVL